MNTFRAVCLIMVLGCILTGLATAAVPSSISYQGRLAQSSGSPFGDDQWLLGFAIYSTPSGGVPLWADTLEVTTKSGLFTTQLGEAKPFPANLFDVSPRYLGITLIGSPEMTPRTPMVSVPYALVAGSVAGGVDCHACDTVFVNAIGPEVLRAAADTALRLVDSGSAARVGLVTRVESGTSDTVTGILTRVTNKSSGQTKGGVFDVRSSSAAAVEGVVALAYGNSSGGSMRGVLGVASNGGTGDSYGGFFGTSDSGSGDHYGVYGRSYGVAGAKSYGVRGESYQNAGGVSEGGSFSGSGGRANYGVRSYGRASNADSAIGVYGYANGWDGIAAGGHFVTDSNGSGAKYGMISEATSDQGLAYGVKSTAKAQGTNSARGIYTVAYNTGVSASSEAYGGYFLADANAGNAYGGRFVASSTSGDAVGVRGQGQARNNSRPVYGIYGTTIDYYVPSTHSGMSYGGYFENQITSGSNAYGIYSTVNATTSASSGFGIYARSEHQGSGSSYGGYVLADSTGTGYSYGIRPVALSKGNAPCWGVASAAANRGTGQVMGGVFEAQDYGTGSKYGVYGKAPSAGYAGYFEGNIRVTGNQTVLGTKSAAVEIAPEEYRLVYSQESPECWFEDFGEGQLVNGKTHIELSSDFLQTVTVDKLNPIKVFIQLNDPDCNGTAVKRGATGFDVVELQNGKSNASFSYRVVAKRKGYESIRLSRMEGKTPKQVAAEVEAGNATLQADEQQQEHSATPRKASPPTREEE